MYYVRRDSIAVLADVGADDRVVLFLYHPLAPLELPRGTCVRRRVRVSDCCYAEVRIFRHEISSPERRTILRDFLLNTVSGIFSIIAIDFIPLRIIYLISYQELDRHCLLIFVLLLHSKTCIIIFLSQAIDIMQNYAHTSAFSNDK